MRKPEPETFAHAVELTGLAPEERVFVDDTQHNVDAAVEIGMTGTLRRSSAETRDQLAEARGVDPHLPPRSGVRTGKLVGPDEPGVWVPVLPRLGTLGCAR